LKPYSKALGPVFHAAFLEEVLDLQKKVENITIYVSKLERYANLLEICYKPLDPDFSACAIFSPLEYFQSESSKLASPRSVEDEIDRQSHSDISTVLISYVVMFVYVSVSLGNYHSWRSIMVSFKLVRLQYCFTRSFCSFSSMIDLKLSLSAGGVIIVLASIFASIGLWSYAGVPATLIIVEVIPFLVLAVGVDNIFIMVQDFSMHSDYTGNDAPEDSHSIDAGQGKDDHYQSVESATDAAYELDVEERISRMMGRIGPSILLSSLSEAVAFFCGAMTSMPAVRVFALYAGVAILINFFLQIFAFVALITLDAKRMEANRLDLLCCIKLKSSASGPEDAATVASAEMETSSTTGKDFVGSPKKSKPWLYRLVNYALAPFILSKWIRPALFIVFLGWICFCIAIIPDGIQIGLDQELSMPLDSYVLSYFKDVAKLLAVGPPVYFVVTEGHIFDTLTGQNQVCGRVGCYNNSLVTTMLLLLLSSGKAQFGNSIALADSVNGRSKRVIASHFMAHHSVLKTTPDFIDAIRKAREVADAFGAQWANEDGRSAPTPTFTPQPNSVFPYSIFYVFYEQYLTVARETAVQLGMSIAAVTAITWIMLGLDVIATLNTIIGVAAILVSVMGLMVLWNISLNAISLVNLVVCIGISVEFCAHIVRAFAISTKVNRVERSLDALSEMGCSVRPDNLLLFS
uniref:SSD domain-containing protein n=1 Tax=Schistocephalus solidus TaxID=70667 RepID=A0A183SY07_SCHSO